MSDNPGLKPRIGEATARTYRQVWIEAAEETDLDVETLPAARPDSFEEIARRDCSL